MVKRLFAVMVVIALAAVASIGQASPMGRVAGAEASGPSSGLQNGSAPVYLPNLAREATSPPEPIWLQLVADGFTSPVALVEPPDGTGRLFIVDQVGLIKIVAPDGALLSEPFLDLRARMATLNPNYDERGLLGLAFHPNYGDNGRFFVYYSAPLREGGPSEWNHTSHISEFQVSADNENLADASSERLLLQVDEPQSNHNGGTLAFGPTDGYLYVSLGDGGGRDDEGTGHVDDWYAFNAGGNGQDITENLLGSILRIDVDSGDPYGIPADNPFVGVDGLDEIYAYGFRNPYRFSFDMRYHVLLVGDVGQELWEEVNVVINGGNYGWNVREGTHCFDANDPNNEPSSCPDTDPSGSPLRDPVLEFLNSKIPGGVGRAVVGGYIYRGSLLSDLGGKYIFGAWNKVGFGTEPTGLLLLGEPRTEEPWRVRDLRLETNPEGHLGSFLLGFGQDGSGEVYVLTTDKLGPSENTGQVFKIVPAGTPSVTVKDQPLVDGGVTIPQVNSAGPGWLVIHAQQNGGTGPVIGHSAVSNGTNRDVAVQIDPAGATSTLYAMLHVDAGQIGVYEFPGPDGPARAGGQVVNEPFTLQVPSQEATVSLRNGAFDPKTLVVLAGATVTWVNEEGLPHTATSDTGLWDSGTLGQTDVYSRTFDTRGVFPYYCAFHGAPGGVGMSGTIVVIE